MTRWVCLVQKTRAKNSHAWAPLTVLKIAAPQITHEDIILEPDGGTLNGNWRKFELLPNQIRSGAVLFI
jgi:hypothetical protein